MLNPRRAGPPRARGKVVLQWTDDFSGPDPFRREAQLDIQSTIILWISRCSWQPTPRRDYTAARSMGPLIRGFNKPPLRLRVIGRAEANCIRPFRRLSRAGAFDEHFGRC